MNRLAFTSLVLLGLAYAGLSRADAIVYESFLDSGADAYTVDVTLGSGANRTEGPTSGAWGGNWAGGDGVPISAPVTLGYVDGLRQLDTSGGLTVSGNTGSTATRRSIADQSAPTYFSFLLHIDSDSGTGARLRAGASFNNSSNSNLMWGIQIDNTGAASIAIEAHVNNQNSGSFSINKDETYLIVGLAEVVDQGGGTLTDDVSIWINPALGVDDPGAADLTFSRPHDNRAGAGASGFAFVAGSDTYLDDVRLGATYEDVTPSTLIPEPAALALLGLGGLLMANRSRRACGIR